MPSDSLQTTTYSNDISVDTLIETANVSYESVDVPMAPTLNSVEKNTTTVYATQWTNTTKEELEVEEVVEYINKTVNFTVTREKIVRVPKYVTRNITKEVVLWTVQENIMY